MSLNAYWADLNRGLADLARVWEDTRGSWDDAVAEDFERRFQEVLERDVRAALEAMSRLGPLLDKARNDCA